MSGVDPALLLSPPQLHAICRAVVSPVDHCGLLMFADGMEAADEFRVVEEVPPRC